MEVQTRLIVRRTARCVVIIVGRELSEIGLKFVRGIARLRVQPTGGEAHSNRPR